MFSIDLFNNNKFLIHKFACKKVTFFGDGSLIGDFGLLDRDLGLLLRDFAASFLSAGDFDFADFFREEASMLLPSCSFFHAFKDSLPMKLRVMYGCSSMAVGVGTRKNFRKNTIKNLSL
jgi:hypothetical protein